LAREGVWRKQAVQALKESEEKYRLYFENAFDIIFSIDSDFKFISISQSVKRILGYRPEELIGKHFQDLNFIAPDYLKKAFYETKHILAGKRIASSEYEFICKDGTRKFAEVSSAPMVREGKVVATVSVARDITERKLAEEKLKKAEKRYSDLFNRITDFIYMHDLDGRFISLNPIAAESLGYTPEKIIGRPLCDFMPEEYRQAFYNEYLPEVKKQESSRGVTAFLHKDGAKIYIEYQNILVKQEDGDQYVSGSGRDITKRLHVERSLEAANRSINDFLTRMSHGIRTPMTAVIGMADLLRETPLVAEQKKFLETIRSSGENILHIINDIRDLSKVEAGQVKLKKATFDLMDVLKNACEAQAFRAQSKDLELVWWIDPDIETRLIGDSVRLDQILSNLIGNAIKFTEKGDVFVEVRQQKGLKQEKAKDVDSGLKQKAGRPVELLFSVTDTGIGIPLEMRKTVFDRFAQVDSSITRKYGGTGLGLAISRRLVKLMNGRIWVESKMGQGSTFYFTAGFEVQHVEEYVPMPKADLTGVKTLIIDDSPTNRMVLSKTLSTWGAQVEEKESGKQGLVEIKRAVDTSDPYALILIDSRMPGLDGFQVAKTIKKASAISSPIIMLLTLGDRKSGMAKGKKLEVTNYLIKPINRSDLKDAVMIALGRKKAIAQKRTVTKLVAREDLKSLYILLVEDNTANQLLIQAFLKKTPYKIDMAENGEIALEKFKAGTYNLVLMDIEMPVMDGYTATKEIRKWEKENRQKATPIIALTAHALKGHTQKSLEAGCNVHLTKPIKKMDLLAAIKKHAL
jgi:PAS domain S-box-containing protein